MTHPETSVYFLALLPKVLDADVPAKLLPDAQEHVVLQLGEDEHDVIVLPHGNGVIDVRSDAHVLRVMDEQADVQLTAAEVQAVNGDRCEELREVLRRLAHAVHALEEEPNVADLPVAWRRSCIDL
eukprot:10847093-Heterocapsa_arctica.AAC.1